MLYVLGTELLYDNSILYTIFETHTDSVIGVTLEKLSEMERQLKTSIKGLEPGWPIKRYFKSESCEYGAPNVLLGRVGEDRFKLVGVSGGVFYVDGETLKAYIEIDNISNCCVVTENGNKIYKSIDTQDNMIADNRFRKSVEDKNRLFESKVKALGLDVEFQYEIEGTEVKIVDYKSTSKKVIIPNFVTSISQDAFACYDIKSIAIGKGVQFIGNLAFDSNCLSELVIPESVKYMFKSAVANNFKIIKSNGEIYEDSMILKGNETILIDLPEIND